MSSVKRRGLLFIVSGPAGSGKTTIINKLIDAGDFVFSVSATTRAPRPGEVDGVDYFFVTKEDFKDRIRRGEMLEYAQYVDNYYGTPRRAVEKQLEEGKDVLLDIEVQGALQVMQQMKDAVSILILPPNSKELEKRLRSRGTEIESVIQARLERAHLEFKYFTQYNYVVISKDNCVDEAADEIRAIKKAESLKSSRNTYIKESFFE
jgi:guanylate kinase